MGELGAVGVGLSVAFAGFLVVVGVEVYHMWNAGRRRRMAEEGPLEAALAETDVEARLSIRAQLRGILGGGRLEWAGKWRTWVAPPPLTATQTGSDANVEEEDEDEDIFQLGGVMGPPRLLYTIQEETKEEMDMANSGGGVGGRGSSSCRASRTSSELIIFLASAATSPFVTPPTSPPFATPMGSPATEGATNSSPCASIHEHSASSSSSCSLTPPFAASPPPSRPLSSLFEEISTTTTSSSSPPTSSSVTPGALSPPPSATTPKRLRHLFEPPSLLHDAYRIHPLCPSPPSSLHQFPRGNILLRSPEFQHSAASSPPFAINIEGNPILSKHDSSPTMFRTASLFNSPGRVAEVCNPHCNNRRQQIDIGLSLSASDIATISEV